MELCFSVLEDSEAITFLFWQFLNYNGNSRCAIQAVTTKFLNSCKFGRRFLFNGIIMKKKIAYSLHSKRWENAKTSVTLPLPPPEKYDSPSSQTFRGIPRQFPECHILSERYFKTFWFQSFNWWWGNTYVLDWKRKNGLNNIQEINPKTTLKRHANHREWLQSLPFSPTSNLGVYWLEDIGKRQFFCFLTFP